MSFLFTRIMLNCPTFGETEKRNHSVFQRCLGHIKIYFALYLLGDISGSFSRFSITYVSIVHGIYLYSSICGSVWPSLTINISHYTGKLHS